MIALAFRERKCEVARIAKLRLAITGRGISKCPETVPRGGLERHILAHRDHSAVGQRGRHLGDAVIDLLEASRAHRDRQVVLAERRPPGGKVVASHRQFAAQAERFVIRRAHPPQRQIDASQRRLPVDEAEALRDDHLVRQAAAVV